ncbi:unnamed protein product [Oikopleura dioica]|uniref:BSD domain-containing protein n=1 Tax=Oikopleura dioica TaxID=34765 RepID=E4YH83_OIKDI|nr:unnamed protein product [Oikopleura dioica]
MEGDAPISKAPSSDDPAPPAPSAKEDEIDKGGWWSSWTPLAKTLTDVSSNLTKTVSQGIEMANQVLDKEIEIEIDVDKMVNATKNIANQTVQHSKNIYEKSSELSKTVAQDVTDLTGALVEDSVETYSVLSEATRSTIEQSSSLFCLNGIVSSKKTAETANAMKNSVFGALNAISSAILADSSDSESEDGKSKSVVSGPAARLANLRTNPATYCNEAEDMVHFLQWTESFNVEGQEIKAEISDIMVECLEVRALYSKLVPSAVAHNDFWTRYFYKLSMLETAESKRSALVERATTDEEEDLESWGDSDSETDEPETHEELPTVEEAKNEEPKAKVEEKPVQKEKIPEEKVEKVKKQVKSDEKKTVSEELKDAAKDEVPVAQEARPETQTPLSNPDSKESWTAVDKSESDDWEQEFELEMTEEEIEKALKNEKKDNKDEKNEQDETEDWSDDE